jgi:hypothetical protein
MPHDPGFPVRYLARPLGVYRTQVLVWTDADDGTRAHFRVRAYIWSASSRRWTKNPTVSYVMAPPRMTEAEARADWEKHYAPARSAIAAEAAR